MYRFIIPVLFFATLIGCQSDPCKDVTCANGGICFEGRCLCPEGFEGSNCETQQMAEFAGMYSATESCNLGNYSYSISIELDTANAQSILIYNLADLGQTVSATVAGSTFDIFKQVLMNDTISGSGLLTDSILTMDYELIPDSGQTLVCNMTCILQ